MLCCLHLGCHGSSIFLTASAWYPLGPALCRPVLWYGVAMSCCADTRVNLLFCCPRRHLALTYGPSWRTPNTTYHGVEFVSGSVNLVYKALLERLSVTAWGSTRWSTRSANCAKLVEQQKRSGQRPRVPEEVLASWQWLHSSQSLKAL